MKKTIKDFEIKNKKVIIRCDFNVPLKDGKILDDNRIVMSIPTIKYALEKGAMVILLSHLGRIKSEEDKKGLSLEVVKPRLEELLETKVDFINETRGSVLTSAVKDMKPGDVILIQNTRYEDFPDKLESSNDDKLSEYWASLGDIFINDAFGTCHRSHASNVGIASHLPSGLGFLVEKEVEALEGKLNNPRRPYTVIMGGAKVSDKIGIISNLIKKADYLILGGGIANTFLCAEGYDLKASVYDKESIDFCKECLSKYKDKIILPEDGYTNTEYADTENKKYVTFDSIGEGEMVLDIGPKSVRLFNEYIEKSKTVFLNGPVGVSEFNAFSYGTKELFKTMDNKDIDVIIGGGDSAAAAINFGYKDEFYHISTGGGASLELIEGKELPGITSIQDK